LDTPFTFKETILTAKTNIMRKFRLLSFSLLAIILITLSCTKEGPEGPVGAQGPQGPPGNTGATGNAGINGTNGTNGTNANVVYSAWILTGTGWTATGAITYGAQFLFDKATTSITQAIMDQGLVLGYIKGEPNTPSIGSQVFQLPYLVGNGFGFLDQYELVLNTPGNIRFLYKSDFAWSAAQLAPISFRYIIIPGIVAGGRLMNGAPASYTADQLKKMTYEEVATMFNIPDNGTNIR
jgi:hypothetical protein